MTSCSANRAVMDCQTGGSCNWQVPFVTSGVPNIGADNKLTIYLTNTRIKYGTPGFPGGTDNCLAEGPQTFGEAGFGTPFNVPTTAARRVRGEPGGLRTLPA
jgi:hypothetical protein